MRVTSDLKAGLIDQVRALIPENEEPRPEVRELPTDTMARGSSLGTLPSQGSRHLLHQDALPAQSTVLFPNCARSRVGTNIFIFAHMPRKPY